MIDLIVRLRNWERVYSCDEGKPDGSLYLEAADRIEELEPWADAAKASQRLARHITGRPDAVVDEVLAEYDTLVEGLRKLTRYRGVDGALVLYSADVAALLGDEK
jgi:hypothetical protein